MQKIIVPTDFSPTAANAYAYAKALAAATSSEIKVIHFFHPAVYSDSIVIPNEEVMLAERNKKLDRFLGPDVVETGTNNATVLAVEKEIVYGLAADEIIKVSKDPNTGFILMGTTGEGGILGKALGSVSSKVSRNTFCPVWLIPPNVTFSGIKNILYAGNYESTDKNVLNKIVSFSAIFDAKVHLVHVNESNKKGDWTFEELVLNRIFQRNAPEGNFQMSTIQSDTVWQGLNEYAEKESIDLIVMVTRYRSFWEKLLHKSATKGMIFNTKKPLLIMHMEDR